MTVARKRRDPTPKPARAPPRAPTNGGLDTDEDRSTPPHCVRPRAYSTLQTESYKARPEMADTMARMRSIPLAKRLLMWVPVLSTCSIFKPPHQAKPSTLIPQP